MTDTTITPTPEAAPTPAAPATPENVLDAAVAATEPTPGTTPAAAPTTEPTFKELSKFSDEQLDALLKADPKIADPAPSAPAAVPPVDPTAAAPAATGEDDPVDPAAPNGYVPLARLNQEIEKRRRSEEEALRLKEERAYFAGKADATAAAPAAPAAPAEDYEAMALKNLQTLTTNYNTAQDTLADKYERGEISYKELKAEERKLNANYQKLESKFQGDIQEARAQKSAPDPRTLQDQINNHPGLKAKTAEIMQQNPWMAELSPELQTPLRDAAVKLLEKEMIFLPDRPTLQDLLNYTYDLRLAMVDVAQTWGFGPKTPAAAGTAAPGAPGAPKADPTAIQSKLRLAGQQPPLPTQAGAALPTDALAGVGAEGMSVEQLSKLPTAQLDALYEREKRANGRAA